MSAISGGPSSDIESLIVSWRHGERTMVSLGPEVAITLLLDLLTGGDPNG